MTRILRSISGVLLFLLIVPVLPAGASFKKTKIAVLDFQLHGERHETTDMGKIVAEWLITALVKEGRFDVIERSLLEKVLHEQKLGVSGVVDEQYASRLGKVLGAKVVITGSLMKLQNMTEVNARIIDVETGAVIAAEIARSTSTAKLEDLVVQMAD
ncbi:MAG TPA: FlgO family outer membrane protein, partial [Nitrospirota bacterium]|nr:FlgO family outer membrane protein [Nitrospirota bacterium]